MIVAIINFAVFKNETAWAVGVHGCVREKSGQKIVSKKWNDYQIRIKTDWGETCKSQVVCVIDKAYLKSNGVH